MAPCSLSSSSPFSHPSGPLLYRASSLGPLNTSDSTYISQSPPTSTDSRIPSQTPSSSGIRDHLTDFTHRQKDLRVRGVLFLDTLAHLLWSGRKLSAKQKTHPAQRPQTVLIVPGERACLPGAISSPHTLSPGGAWPSGAASQLGDSLPSIASTLPCLRPWVQVLASLQSILTAQGSSMDGGVMLWCLSSHLSLFSL